MPRFARLSCFLTVVGFATTAFAQPPRPTMRPPGMESRWTLTGELSGMLPFEAVQRELQLTAEQKVKLHEIDAAFARERGSVVTELRQLRSEAPELDQEALSNIGNREVRKLTDIFEGQILEELTPAQHQRLREIRWQAKQGTSGRLLRYPETAQALGLSSEQVEKINAIDQAYADQLKELGGDESLDLHTLVAKVAEIRRTRDEKTFNLLTDEQKQALEKLKGKPFDLDSLRAATRGFPTQGGNAIPQ